MSTTDTESPQLFSAAFSARYEKEKKILQSHPVLLPAAALHNRWKEEFLPSEQPVRKHSGR